MNSLASTRAPCPINDSGGLAHAPFRPETQLLTDLPYPTRLRPTLDDLDPDSATTDALVAMVRRHREGEEYPTGEQLIGNLPKVLRALGDHVLSGQATALDVAYRLASIIDALESCLDSPAPLRRTH